MLPAVFYAHPFALMQCMLKGMQRLMTSSATQSRLASFALLLKLQSNATNHVENTGNHSNT